MRTSVLAVTVTLALATAAAWSSTAAAAVGPCTDVQVIGLRGSGEPLDPKFHDMGSLVGPVADLVAEQVAGAATVSFYGVPYKAGDAGVVTVLSGSYFDSKNQGMSMLHDYLTEVTKACPSMKLVVMGYSQGAHAAGHQLAKEPASVTDHVRALILFADPRFNPATVYAGGDFDPTEHGLAGARSASDFAAYSNRVSSFCRRHDIICQGKDLLGHNTTDEHAEPKYLAAFGALTADRVRLLLGYPRTVGANLPLDLAFVIDSTGSMGGAIRGVADSAGLMAQKLKTRGADFHVGLVDYKDTDQGDPYGAQVDVPMTTDVSVLKAGLDALQASGGGDGPEAVLDGVMTAIKGLSWRTVPRKAIIVMGDAAERTPSLSRAIPPRVS